MLMEKKVRKRVRASEKRTQSDGMEKKFHDHKMDKE
jgi:hypothetical protein